ncbi:MAG: TetR family transcriptional regulator [Pseudomonadota bacterium]
MTAAEKTETKEKIIDVARELFAQFGYNGTSIRQIADQSGVNIAAVNYHFGGKGGLYWSVIDSAYDWIEDGVKDISANAESIEDVSRSLFRFLREGDSYVISTMRTLLSGSSAPKPEKTHPHFEKMHQEYFGPPGGQHVIAFLTKHYGAEVSQDAKEWLVMCLFSSIFHFATMCAAPTFEDYKKGKTTDQEIEDGLVEMSTALALHMKKVKVGGDKDYY